MTKQNIKKARSIRSTILDGVEETKNVSEDARIENRMLLAAKIFEAMQRQGISKSKLAGLLGQHPSVITKWLSGTHNFTTDTLTDIESALKIRLFAHNVEQKKQMVIEKRVVAQLVMAEPQHVGFSYGSYHFLGFGTQLPLSESYSSIPLRESLQIKKYA
jgi:ribosome-binding protein aMBF1 (putative translation factor)